MCNRRKFPHTSQTWYKIRKKRGKSTRVQLFLCHFCYWWRLTHDYDDDYYWLTSIPVHMTYNTETQNTRKYTSIYKIHKKISDSFIQNVNARWWCCYGECCSVLVPTMYVIWYECLSFLFIIIIMLMISSSSSVCICSCICELLRRCRLFCCYYSVYLYQNIYIYRNPRGLISMRVLFRYVFVVWFYRILFYFVRKYIWMDDVLLHLSTKHIIWCSTNSFVCQSHMF